MTAHPRYLQENAQLPEIVRIWRRHLVRALSEALAGALRPNQINEANSIERVLQALNRLCEPREIVISASHDALVWARRLFERDMGSVPFRTTYFEKRFGSIEPKAWPSVDNEIASTASIVRSSPFEEEQSLKSLRSFLSSIKESERVVPIALAYPTRPFRTDELYLLVPDLLHKGKSKIRDWAKAFRGFSLGRRLPGSRNGGGGPIVIPFAKPITIRRIAVTSWGTSEDSWKAAVATQPDPDHSRYQRLSRLMNGILGAKNRPDYVILHELSMPWHWFRRTASKLQEVGISLIAGIEYLPVEKNKTVANEVWASLVSSFIGHRAAIVYRQKKAQAALHEELDLRRVGGLELDVKNSGKPILRHGKFHFGILVCSELTNAEYRKDFRGNVDAVFVPEWNKDTETFSSLIEASALDIHAFMIQCNNRIHGDSRIRVPSANSWNRDIVRVKGGIEDYFVIGEIDVMKLRAFQSNYRSPPNGEFKPVPDGFKMDESRKTVPD